MRFIHALFATRERQFSCFAVLLYLFNIYGHIPVSNVCYYLRDTYTEATYTLTIQLTGLALAALFSSYLCLRLIRPSVQYPKLGAWLLFGGIIAYYYQQLIVFAIEYVHFMQYALFTLCLITACHQRLLLALSLSLLAGFFDEVYQAYHPSAPLNWRDILLNVIGVSAGGLLHWSLAPTPRAAGQRFLS